jgi:hypothetical protein
MRVNRHGIAPSGPQRRNCDTSGGSRKRQNGAVPFNFVTSMSKNFLRQRCRVKEGLYSRLPEAPSSLMLPFLVMAASTWLGRRAQGPRLGTETNGRSPGPGRSRPLCSAQQRARPNPVDSSARCGRLAAVRDLPRQPRLFLRFLLTGLPAYRSGRPDHFASFSRTEGGTSKTGLPRPRSRLARRGNGLKLERGAVEALNQRPNVRSGGDEATHQRSILQS